MKIQLFAALLGALLSVAFCAPPVDDETRAANCDFIIDDIPAPCPAKKLRIPIPCVSQCASYYECDDDLRPKLQTCKTGNFNATTLVCDSSEAVNCEWFLTTTSSTSTTSTESTSTQTSTTPKTGGATTSNPAILLVLGVAMATIASGFF